LPAAALFVVFAAAAKKKAGDGVKKPRLCERRTQKF